MADSIPTDQAEPMLRYFSFEHLPPHLQQVSAQFSFLAHKIVKELPRTPERTVALRKLLESKDAAVRCAVDAFLLGADPQAHIGQIWRSKKTGATYKISSITDHSVQFDTGVIFFSCRFDVLHADFELVTEGNR